MIWDREKKSTVVKNKEYLIYYRLDTYYIMHKIQSVTLYEVFIDLILGINQKKSDRKLWKAAEPQDLFNISCTSQETLS